MDEDLIYESQPEAKIGFAMRAFMSSLGELTRLAAEHPEAMGADLFDLAVCQNRLALIISAIQAKHQQLMAAE